MTSARKTQMLIISSSSKNNRLGSLFHYYEIDLISTIQNLTYFRIMENKY